MIVACDAIALKIMPFSETSRVVIWLTDEYGKIPSLIKGSQRLKSFFIGQYDLFYRCELLYYQKTHHSLHIVKELYPEKQRGFLRKNWRATACVSYLASLTNRVLPYYAPHPQLFRLLDETIDCFASSTPVKYEAMLCWFELKLLKELGFKPQLDLCARCGKTLDVSGFLKGNFSGRGIHFSYKDGGALCLSCMAPSDNERVLLAPDVFALLSNWNNARTMNSVFRVVSLPEQLEVISSLIDKFIVFHLEQTGYNRAVAMDILKWRN
jgi:DNA repair protein RecO (recombination protein O)